ncbi:hypothetical protein R1sor_014665 [Riccia sorocarpa]|uniref:Uncharacterized protein n=1 Tax=Riccia sorocarpa TaxID=122646 RepID=A0ABD3HBV3_9MARC
MAHSDEERYSAEEALNEESESQNIAQSCSDDQEVEEVIEEEEIEEESEDDPNSMDYVELGLAVINGRAPKTCRNQGRSDQKGLLSPKVLATFLDDAFFKPDVKIYKIWMCDRLGDAWPRIARVASLPRYSFSGLALTISRLSRQERSEYRVFVTGMATFRRVREGTGYRIDLEGMFLKPRTFAWFKFSLGTIFEIPDLPDNVVLYERYQLMHGAFYLPPEFDLNNDLTILRQERRGTRLRGRVTMPPGHWYTMISENNVWYYVEPPYSGEDFSAAFLTNEGMELRFPARSSLYMPKR